MEIRTWGETITLYIVLLNCLVKLSKLPIQPKHFRAIDTRQTVIGMTKEKNSVSGEARILLKQWKAIAAKAESNSNAPQKEDAATKLKYASKTNDTYLQS